MAGQELEVRSGLSREASEVSGLSAKVCCRQQLTEILGNTLCMLSLVPSQC